MKNLLFLTLKVLVLIAALCLAYGFLVEPRLLKVRQVKVTAAISKPIKIALISDLHIGGLHVPAERITQTAAKINAQNPDIIFLAGDYVNGHKRREDHAQAFNDKLDRGLAALSNLSMHSPDSFQYLRPDTVIAVAGHTHGGQINLPFLGRAITATQLGKPYAYGVRDWQGIPVVITAGLGTSILPARFRSAPEIVIIELAPAL